MDRRLISAPSALAALFLAFPAPAQHATPCFNLIDQIEEKARAISAGQDRISKILESDIGAPGRRSGAACQTARGLIGQSNELAAFAEERRSRCENGNEQAALDAAISMGSAKLARSLAQVFCKE